MSSNRKASSMEWLEVVREKVQSLEFGVVQIVVHDRRVTQIERTERMRLVDSPARLPNHESSLSAATISKARQN